MNTPRLAALALLAALVTAANAAQPATFVVSAMSPAPGATVTTAPASITVTLSAAPDPASVSSGTVRVLRPGTDGLLGTPDDVPLVPSSVTTLGSTITIGLAGQVLPNGLYGVSLAGNEAVIPDLVNHWRLDETGATTTAADSAGALPGTVTGANWSWVPGRLGNAWNNAGDFTGDKIALSGSQLATPWTAAMWVKRLDSSGSEARLMDGLTSLRLENYPNTNQVGVVVYGGSGATFTYSAPVDVWTHLTLVGTGSGTTLWVNGAPVQTVAVALTAPRGYIGSDAVDSSLRGAIDDLRLYSRALNADEIAAVASLGGAIRNAAGERLDGEFTGTLPSGNGLEGGNYLASFTINAPAPTVTALSPAAGSTFTAPDPTFIATFSAPIDPTTVNPYTVSVIRAGADGMLGTGDDVPVTPSDLTLLTPTDLRIIVPGPNDTYRVTLRTAVVSVAGAVDYWAFDAGTGATAVDSAGPYNGSLSGPMWVHARSGSGLRFVGSQDRVVIAAPDIPPPWTAAMWVRRDDSPAGDARLMDSIAFGSGTSLRLEQYNNTNQVGMTAYGGTDYSFGYTAAVSTWTHLAFVGTGSGTQLYANGTLVGTVPSLSLSRYNIGSQGDNSMRGILDEVRIYGTALNVDEVRVLSSLGGAIRNTSQVRLDGEFGGTFPSGNGFEGGDFVFTYTLAVPAPPGGGGGGGGGCGATGAEGVFVLILARLLRRRRSTSAAASP